jgi:integrase
MGGTFMSSLLLNKYKFVVREVSVLERTGGNWEEVRRIILGVQDLETEIIYPHPLSDFIEKEYYFKSVSLSHQKRPAETVQQFLNYIIESIEQEDKDFIELRHNGLKGLRLEHGVRFLKYCNEERGNSYETVKGKEMYLTHFFDFLKDQNLLENEPKINSYEKGSGRKKKTILVSPFKNFKYPKRDNPNKFKKKKDLVTPTNPNRLLFIREFLLTAKYYDPGMALAIAFQCFGGLRGGECMNLKLSSIKKVGRGIFGENGMYLEIRDKQEELFKHLKNTDMVQVKNPRDQALLRDSILSYLYRNHLKWRDNFIKQNKDYNKVALFLDEEGNAMSGQNYRKRFNKVKKIYLDLLSNKKGRLQDYKELKETHWSSHIGRGSFTNMCIECGMSVEQTAIARGDKSIGQAIHYTDIINATYNISRAIGMLDKKSTDIELVNIPDIKRSWKDVYNFGAVRN